MICSQVELQLDMLDNMEILFLVLERHNLLLSPSNLDLNLSIIFYHLNTRKAVQIWRNTLK